MPRSKNLNSYEQFFWDLLEAMDQSPGEITFDLPAHRAHRLRHRTYGFIYALETQAERQEKKGDIEGGHRIREQANAFRRYLIRVTVNGTPVSHVKPYDATPAQLQFVNRDLTLENIDLLEQLRKQVKYNGASEAPEEEILPPSLDEFFDTNLKTPEGEVRELNEDEGNPSNSSEEPPA